jgi:hypothetical protein
MPSSRFIFSFTEELWLYPGESANWHFVSVPKDLSTEIKNKFGKNARGWGSLPVEVTIGESRWRTSIFPEKKSGTYLLPVKANVRAKEGLHAGMKVEVRIKLING